MVDGEDFDKETLDMLEEIEDSLPESAKITSNKLDKSEANQELLQNKLASV